MAADFVFLFIKVYKEKKHSQKMDSSIGQNNTPKDASKGKFASLIRNTLSASQKDELEDDAVRALREKLRQRKENVPPTAVEKAEAQKVGVERTVEDSDKTLNELLQLGTELVTNVKVANEKREVARRNYELMKQRELTEEINAESVQAMAKFEDIMARWADLQEIKEPMGLFKELEAQKARISDLLNQKDEAIDKCKREIKRADEAYEAELQGQSADIHSLVERIDTQIELVRQAYKDHLELLQQTIAEERNVMAEEATRKWNDLYEKCNENDKKKLENEKTKRQFYEEELKRIAEEHAEIKRATRIRLDKETDALQLELHKTKNNVALNSEKMMFNYKILLKREDQNELARKQLKKRLTRLNEKMAALNKEIEEAEVTREVETKRLTKEVLQLQKSIVDVEAKAANFYGLNDKKYRAVWEVNYQEAMTLLGEILEVDRVLNEQQLGQEWSPPPELEEIERSYSRIKKSFTKAATPKSASARSEAIKTPESQSTLTDDVHSKLYSKILGKLADRAGFLVEEKLDVLLKPYPRKERTLVKINNIFRALDITTTEEIEALLRNFLQYSCCPNCTKVSVKDSEELTQEDPIPSEADAEQHKVEEPETIKVEEQLDKIDEEIAKILQKTESSMRSEATPAGKEQKCENHTLVIKNKYILIGLREFLEKKLVESTSSSPRITSRESDTQRMLKEEEITEFWSLFAKAFPDNKQKFWNSMEYALKNYLDVLKEREELDKQVMFLRKQNSELKHLLQNQVPKFK